MWGSKPMSYPDMDNPYSLIRSLEYPTFSNEPRLSPSLRSVQERKVLPVFRTVWGKNRFRTFLLASYGSRYPLDYEPYEQET